MASFSSASLDYGQITASTTSTDADTDTITNNPNSKYDVRDEVQGPDTGRQLRVNRPFACIKKQGWRQSYVDRFLSSLWQPVAPALTRRVFGRSGSKALFRLVVEEFSYDVFRLLKQLNGVHARQIFRRSCTKAADQ